MRHLVYVWALVFSWQAGAGVITGTIATKPQPLFTNNHNDHFWQLQTPLSAEEGSPAIVLLQGEAALTNEFVPPTITIEGYGFQPKFAIVPAGATIKFKNLDGRSYSCRAVGADEFQFNDLAEGAVIEQKLPSAGTVEIRCQRYPFMRLNLLVVGKAMFTIADASGNFAFKNVPAGDYQATVYSNGSFCCGTAVKVQNQPMQLALSFLTKTENKNQSTQKTDTSAVTPSNSSEDIKPTNQAKLEPTKPTPMNTNPLKPDQGKPEPRKPEAVKPEVKPTPAKPEQAKIAPIKQPAAEVTQPPKEAEPAKPVKDKGPAKAAVDKKPKKAGGEAGDSLFKDVEPEIEIEE